MRLYYDRERIVRLATTGDVATNCYESVEIDQAALATCGSPIGKRIVFRRPGRGLRLALVCNWGDACGIATYSKFLLDALRPLVEDVRIFAEDTGIECGGDGEAVEHCWKRGHSMAKAMRRVIDWQPSVVLIQHEFGIFPKAPYLLQMFQMLDNAGIPHVVTLHSVYEHLDKVVCTAAMRNIVVHSTSGRDCLHRLGHTAKVQVIPHGCVAFDAVEENWNITHTPYAIIQFGFGFNYKGVDVALDAVAKLKSDQSSKYGEIHYCYLCSESPHVRTINNDYYRLLMRKIEELGLTDNAVVIRGFQTDEVLNQYLRTYKLAVFPYVSDPRNVVYGASGAIRLAMANRIPTVASSSHMFDDLDGFLPRPSNSQELAREIDLVFSNDKYKRAIIDNEVDYVRENSWPIIARRYLGFLQEVVQDGMADAIVI